VTATVCYLCAINTTFVPTDIIGNSTSGEYGGGVCVPLPGNCSEGIALTASATT